MKDSPVFGTCILAGEYLGAVDVCVVSCNISCNLVTVPVSVPVASFLLAMST
jgi:hypothetical protein